MTVDEAKTFYPLFGLGANVALIFSGRAVKYFSQVTLTSKCRFQLLHGLLRSSRPPQSGSGPSSFPTPCQQPWLAVSPQVALTSIVY